jgi:hypothetical protein
MGRYHVMLGDDPHLSNWYRFEWRLIGYLGGDALAAALAPLIGLEPAVKLILLAIPVLTVAGVMWISVEAHGRVQPLALFALPFAYHLALQYGFINYTLAMALALNAWALWLRLGRLSRTRLRALVFVPIACAIWAAHVSGWLVLGVLVFAAELAAERRRNRSWLAAAFFGAVGCLPLALPGLMFLGWRPDVGGGGSDWIASLKFKPGWIAMALRDRWRWFDVGSVILVALMLYRSVRSPQRKFSVEVAIAATLLFTMFIAMPFLSAYADMRLAPYVIMLALLAMRSETYSMREQTVIASIGLLFIIVRIGAGAASLWIESRDWSRHLEAIEHLPRGARVASFVTSACEQPWHMQRLAHLPSMAIVRRGAFTNDQFNLGSTALLRVVAPGISGFDVDPSQIVVDRPCPASPEFRTLDDALARFPRDRFDYVWLIAPRRLDLARTQGLSLIWSNGSDMLFRVETTAAEAARSAHRKSAISKVERRLPDATAAQ